MERRRVRAKPEVRREQILDQATRLIGERGYYGFGIKELAQRCGLGNAGLLHHFGSKERLLISLLEDRDRKHFAAATSFLGWSQAIPGAPISLSQFRELLRDTVRRNIQQPELIRLYAVLQAEALNHSHPAHDYFLAREVTVLDGFISALGPHVAEPRSVARQLHALWQGLEQQWLRADQGFDIIEAWDRAVANLLPSEAAPLRRASAQHLSL